LKTVFISRKLNADSIFYKMLSEANIKVIGQSLIELEAIDFQSIPKTEWIFFYSKNAITFFFENIKKQSFPFDENHYKWATIGEGTAKRLADYQIKADFVGNGNPELTAIEFLKKAKNKTVLFPRATTSQQSIQKILSTQIQSLDLLIYKNQPLKDIESRSEAVLVFTSPMNASAYFDQNSLKNNQKLVAIGQTTAKALKALHFEKMIIASEPSEKGLAEAILSCRLSVVG
jgi:uroporphyrinogen-III synthase